MGLNLDIFNIFIKLRLLILTSFCYGVDLKELVIDESKVTEEDTEGVVDRLLRDEFGFKYFDFDAVQTYDSIDHIVSTYGFIFGQQAIDYIQKTERKHITWTSRVHYLIK